MEPASRRPEQTPLDSMPSGDVRGSDVSRGVVPPRDAGEGAGAAASGLAAGTVMQEEGAASRRAHPHRTGGEESAGGRRRAEAELQTFGWAEPSSIVRAGQKDELYTQELLASITDAVEATVGAGFINRHKSAMRAAADVLYLFLTTVRGNPTLGEEYVDIRQVSHHSEQPSRLGRRTALVIWRTLIPYLAVLLQVRDHLVRAHRRHLLAPRPHATPPPLITHAYTTISHARGHPPEAGQDGDDCAEPNEHFLPGQVGTRCSLRGSRVILHGTCRRAPIRAR